MMDSKFAGKPMEAHRPNLIIDQMPDTPNRRGHRRAQSETFSRSFLDDDYDDDLMLDDVVAEFNLANLDFPSLSSDASVTIPSSAADVVGHSGGGVKHFRSLSVDADFFDGLGLGSTAAAAEGLPESKLGRMGYSHRHSNSMDGGSGSTATSSFDGVLDNTKKALAPDKLVELSLIDPKRAKRILANRQSAARSKERKVRYMSELERKVQTLLSEATSLTAQVTKLQRDTTGLTSENKELKLRLQAMEQQAHLRDTLNETLREEVQRLKIVSGQIPSVNGSNFNRLFPPHNYSSHPQAMHHFGGQNTQQLQQQQQQQYRIPSSSNDQIRNGQQQPTFMDFK